MKTCPCGHRPGQHPPAGVLAAFRATPAPDAYSCTGPGCGCLMSAEQATESLVDTLDVTSGQIEDKTMTDPVGPMNLRELLDYWEARRQDAIHGRYSPEPNSSIHIGTYAEGLKRCSTDLERVIHGGKVPPMPVSFICTLDNRADVLDTLRTALVALEYQPTDPDTHDPAHPVRLGRLIADLEQQLRFEHKG